MLTDKQIQSVFTWIIDSEANEEFKFTSEEDSLIGCNNSLLGQFILRSNLEYVRYLLSLTNEATEMDNSYFGPCPIDDQEKSQLRKLIDKHLTDCLFCRKQNSINQGHDARLEMMIEELSRRVKKSSLDDSRRN